MQPKKYNHGFTKLPKVLFTLGMFLWLMVACNPAERDTVCFMYKPVMGKGWNKTDTLDYRLPPGLKPGVYRISVEIRHSNQYPFQDIWLSLSHNLIDSLHFTTDSVHLQLADTDGNWIAGSTAGSLFQAEAVLPGRISVTRMRDSATVRITHIMRRNPLPGVSDIGLKLSLTRSIDSQKNIQQDGKTPK